MPPPHRIGNYEVRSLLSEAATGAIYLCEHVAAGRTVAIKLLPPSLTGDRERVSRLAREARAASGLHHPGIADVLAIEFAGDGPPYVVMEHLSGEPLAARIRRARLSVLDAVAITLQAATALGAAHDSGIVHGALEPESVFLVPDPLSPVPEKVKLLDFGVAELYAAGATGPGTAQYRSPEQGRGQGADHRSDVYALGVVLYEMLCGQPPFVGSFDAVVAMHREQAPPPPSTRNRTVSPRIERAILCALAKQPEERFASMRELRQALGDPEIMPLPRAMVRAADRGAGALPATLHLTDTAFAEGQARPGEVQPARQGEVQPARQGEAQPARQGEVQPGHTVLLPESGGTLSAEPLANGSIEMSARSLPPRAAPPRGRRWVVIAVAAGALAVLAGLALEGRRLGVGGAEPTVSPAPLPAAPAPAPAAPEPPAAVLPPAVAAPAPAATDEPALQPTLPAQPTAAAAPTTDARNTGQRKGKTATARPGGAKPKANHTPRGKDDADPMNVPKW